MKTPKNFILIIFLIAILQSSFAQPNDAGGNINYNNQNVKL